MSAAVATATCALAFGREEWDLVRLPSDESLGFDLSSREAGLVDPLPSHGGTAGIPG
jgi:hypothetical protein